jgi:TolA-binding protein
LLPIAAPAPDLGSATAAAGSTGVTKLVVVSLISAAVGAGGGAAGHAYYASRQPAPVVATVAPVLAPPAASIAVAPVETVPVPAVESAAPPPAPSAREPVKATSSLRAERLLLETASAALMKGDHASAIAALKQHQARFPKGELAQEREVLLVQALKASGNDRAADERAKDFKKKFPGSLQQDSVDKASKPK